MADKAISELVSAEQITATDLFVLQQNDTAKKLPGQVLLNWLTAAADGHGGIKSIEKLKTSGLADTYRITLADTTTFDFVVNNGRSIRSIVKISTSSLVDTYRISYNDNTTDTFAVTNGEKGEKGDNAYIWIKYASQEPTASSHSFGDLPDAWIGVYFGTSSIAPSDWQQYKWYQWKGAKGDKGDPATLVSSNVEYQVSSSGTVVPSGSWSSSVLVVPQGMYLWTKITNTFNTGSPVISYSVSRMGLDGSGSVSSVANISPDENGNVPLDAASVKALPIGGGTMEGAINMNGQSLFGLNAPTKNDQAANMGFVNQQVRKAAPHNLLDNSDFQNPVMQAGFDGLHGSERYVIDRWRRLYGIGVVSEVSNGILISGADTECYINQKIDITNIVGKAVTMAVCTSEEGILCGSVVLQENTDMQVFVSKNGLHLMTNGGGFTIRVIAGYAYTVEWIALYEGEYTADTLPKYQPKGYGAELLECQRYYAKINGAIAYGVATSNGKAEFLVPHPTTMRKQWPSYVFKNNLWAYKGDGGALFLSITGVSTTSGSIRIYADLENGTNTIISVPDVNVEVSADIL